MFYNSAVGLPRLDLIIPTDGVESAARATFSFSTDDFFGNAFDANTSGTSKAGLQGDAGEADERRKKEDDDLEAFRDAIAEMAYLNEQVEIGGVSMTVAEHGKLGNRLKNDAAYRAAVKARMKQDNPSLTDGQIDSAMEKYSEWARLRNIPPGQRTPEEEERLRVLEPQVRSDPTIGAVVRSANTLNSAAALQRESSLQNQEGGRAQGAAIDATIDQTAAFAELGQPVVRQTSVAANTDSAEVGQAALSQSAVTAQFAAVATEAPPALTQPTADVAERVEIASAAEATTQNLVVTVAI